MSVVWVEEHWEGRGGEFSWKITEHSATRFFKIKTDNKLDDQNTIEASGLLPAKLSPHPGNPILTARKLNFQQMPESPYAWEATCSYSSSPLTDEENEDDNPLVRPAKIRLRSVQYERATIVDRDGNPYLSSAHEPYDPQLVDDARWVIEVEKNIGPTWPDWIFDSNNKLNASSFTVKGRTAEAEKAKLQDVNLGEVQVENDVPFIVLSFNIHYRREGWKRKLLDEGYLELVDGEQKVIKVKGDRPSKPVRLDGSGRVQTNPTAGNAQINEFDDYETMEFSVLPLQ